LSVTIASIQFYLTEIPEALLHQDWHSRNRDDTAPYFTNS